MKHRLVMDIDGVLADLMKEWLALYNREYDDTLTEKDIVDWNIHKFTKSDCGERVYDYLSYPNLYTNVKPYVGARNFVTRIRDMMPITFATTTVDGSEGEKLKFLKRYSLFEVGVDEYIETKSPEDKHAIDGTFMVDDYIENLNGFKGIPIMPHRAWNAQYTDYPNRFYSYEQIIAFVGREMRRS